MQTWMVRAGRGSEFIDTFLSTQVVALSNDLGRTCVGMSRDAIAQAMRKDNEEASTGSVSAWVSQLVRFRDEVKVGDGVVTYDSDTRLYHVGSILSDIEYRPNQGRFSHVRQVEWTAAALRDALSVSTRNTLGAIQSFFLLSDSAAAELADVSGPVADVQNEVAKPDKPPAVKRIEEADEDEIREDVETRARQFAEDLINSLKWDEMEELVAGVLRGMGYRTRVSATGADRGVDIFASPDGLGLEEPRIFVEVKHRQSKMGSQQIRQFLGGRSVGDKCLYVSTGGFSKDARYEADRSSIPITLLNLSDLTTFVLQVYDQLDPETRALVPMKKIYWPVG